MKYFSRQFIEAVKQHRFWEEKCQEKFQHKNYEFSSMPKSPPKPAPNVQIGDSEYLIQNYFLKNPIGKSFIECSTSSWFY